ncbi:hypothetical protein PSN45_002836 [Yamadazyma tenuis]|uniref:PCI domain-containing protein n=1 Tax=Candida tenuis (strain ATCC 10573 / BCRC 21748 / CBS 615 / JCM 9827 / NBRC 10315 / NRRL Y-1498 / VKM Y-70) TaxID=590646 RepID=G3AWK0_CANTC|nr:uncharacterized protein CANTEDRAFT_112276 [Yamadazyma tenuis ATCC 10573]XP_006684071.1 uncharacterized protein CANTEDRAFT_112276 [Yamadazyma tenuis ATCC 10573]EGV66812.1 hypothetical protein CANTEDRAFT_112276 [Yamadazyma tenuis ATCC 10573]EGV66813.1 hypothetical protein CANTEDRAFT_112276 [Yamadazyma tenuis ATCC 10573]WEJ95321.1 hypothetical protein PSN45_002836 [Yamadazyma tenuis]
MNQLLRELQQCSELPVQQQLHKYEGIFNVDPQSNPRIREIYKESYASIKDIDKRVDQANLFDNDWLAFNEVVISFIKLSNQLNPYSLLESFDLYGKFLEDVSTAFSHYNKGWLLKDLVKSSVKYIFSMANKLDFQLYYKGYCSTPRLSWLASILLKVFNNIRSQTNEENTQKSSIIIFIGSNLCSIYFKIDNPLLCRNVFSNINTLNLSSSKFPKNEILSYRFYLSKFYLIKNQLIDSYQHLTWCLSHCPIIPNHPNIIKILKLLLPISILIGKKPNFKFIKSTYLSKSLPKFILIYQKLSREVSSGNIFRFNQVVSNNRKYFKSLGLLLTIESKGTVLLVRNLFKKVWIILGKPLKLEYDILIASLKCAGFDIQTDDLIIENLLVSLIDQNLLKGKIFPRLRVASLARDNVFPPVDEIGFIRFGNGNGQTLNPNDTWLTK